jgi:diguanylate cyclase (GGDEF)-like protein
MRKMGTVRQGWRHLHETWRLTLHGLMKHHATLSERFSLGIIARLAIFFVGVGGLVLATSFAVEHGVLVERTTQITQLPVPFIPSREPVTVVPDAIVEPTEAATPPEKRIVTSEALSLARNRFEGAAHERITAKTEQTEANFQRSNEDLDRTATIFCTTAASISGKSQRKVSAALKAHQQLGESLVLEADARHEMLLKYATLLDGLKTRDKSSVDKAWKIFGRVVTRQSLLQLSADLDILLHHSAALDLADDLEPTKMAAFLKAETTVQKDLDDNQNALTRSEGAAWYTAMHAEFAALMAMRELIVRANEEISRGMREFAQQAADLTKLVPGKVESPIAPRQAQTSVPVVPVSIARLQIDPIPISSAIAPPAVVETQAVTKDLAHNNVKRSYIRWISAAVVALLAYIAIGTAMSIILPVRRLVRAAAQLAQGDTSVRMRRGGLNELNTVAVAFNLMAEEIAAAKGAARDYQESLELKVTERTRQLQELAEHDPLTGLPNRRELFVLLNAAIQRAQAESEQVAVFFLDVDNFKYINDSMGHAFGDRVLVSLARRLQETTLGFGFAARLGGDEFTVVFEHARSSEAIRAAGTSIVQAFQKPLTVDGRDLIVSVSVGASIYPEHEIHAEGLLKAADAALFRAKAMGRGQLSVFTPELLEAAAAKFTLEQGLRRAIERGEFELVFQPEIGVETLKTALVEALIRWRTPEGSLLLPGEFLAIAEESGLIMEISDWVLRSAIEAAAHWHHGAWPEVCVAINVLPRQLIDAGFVERLRDLLRTHRLPSRCIEIELTESVLQTGPATIDALRRLRAHGIAIALDDFGTGYSSLASLEQLPLSRIKLDRSLIAGIDNSPRAAAIANAIIVMCQGLGLDITAEGVERPEQFAMLVRHRGMYMQGYLLAHPTSRDELIPLLEIVAQRSQQLLLESSALKAPELKAPEEMNPPRPRLQIVSDTG